ncbi:MAG: hydroxypyruvate isomerase [Arenicellales bacterium]
MLKFCANLSMLFNEMDFLDRFEAAAGAGFKGVEYQFPYGYDKELLAERLQRYGLTQVLHNLPPGDWEGGERGIACLPDRTGEFQESVGLAIEYAIALDCPQVNCLAGIVPRDANANTVSTTLIDNLEFAANELSHAGIRLLVEPINTRDVPGFYLNGTRQAADIMDTVRSDNLALQYDVYHMQIMEGDLTPTIDRLIERIAHFQVADNPGRHEPGTGEINYPFVFDFIDKLGYNGWIGCEYRPATTTLEGLGWLDPYL